MVLIILDDLTTGDVVDEALSLAVNEAVYDELLAKSGA
jgi:hypothetical protein